MSQSVSRSAPDALLRCLRDDETAALLTEAENSGHIAAPLLSKLARLGLFALSVPASHGGLELGLAERADLHRTLGAVSASLQSIVTVHEMAVHGIKTFASAETRRRYLPNMAAGDCLGAFALTEPGGGSSLRQMATWAGPHGNGFLLHGEKSWVSAGLRAGVFLIVAKGEDGVRCFIADRANPGLLVSPAAPLVAFRAAALGDLHLVDCVVGQDDAVGPAGLAGLRVVVACLALGRILVAAGALGVTSSALELLIRHANQRRVGHAALASQPLARAAVAMCYVDYEAALALLRAAISAQDAFQADADRKTIAAKLFTARAARRATSAALRLHGALGLAEATPLQRYRAESDVYEIIEGSPEVLSLTLGADLMTDGGFLHPMPECPHDPHLAGPPVTEMRHLGPG